MEHLTIPYHPTHAVTECRYRLKPGKKKVTMKEIEEKFGGPVEIVPDSEI